MWARGAARPHLVVVGQHGVERGERVPRRHVRNVAHHSLLVERHRAVVLPALPAHARRGQQRRRVVALQLDCLGGRLQRAVGVAERREDVGQRHVGVDVDIVQLEGLVELVPRLLRLAEREERYPDRARRVGEARIDFEHEPVHGQSALVLPGRRQREAQAVVRLGVELVEDDGLAVPGDGRRELLGGVEAGAELKRGRW